MHGKDRTSININYFVFVWFLDNSYGPDVMTKYLHVGRTLSTLWSSWMLQHAQLCELIKTDFKIQKIGGKTFFFQH